MILMDTRIKNHHSRILGVGRLVSCLYRHPIRILGFGCGSGFTKEASSPLSPGLCFSKQVTSRELFLGYPLRGTMELSQVVMMVKAGQVEGGIWAQRGEGNQLLSNESHRPHLKGILILQPKEGRAPLLLVIKKSWSPKSSNPWAQFPSFPQPPEKAASIPESARLEIFYFFS